MPRLVRSVSIGIPLASATYAVTLTTLHFAWQGWKPHRVQTAWLVFGAIVLGALALRAWRLPADAPASPAPERAGHRALWLLLAGATVAIYGRALNVGLLSDDFVLLELSPGSTGWGSFFRPVPVWLFWLANRTGAGGVAERLHALSLLLHVLNGWLVLLLARRLHLPPTVSLPAAALFLLFPASVEAVVWCAALQDVLAATGSLAFLLVALGRQSMLPGLAAFAMALLSKESAVAVPFIAAALLAARDGRIERSRRAGLALAALAAIAFGIWRLQAVGDGLAPGPSRYVLKNLLSMAFGTLAIPWTIAEVRAAPALPVLMTGLVAAVALVAIAGWRAAARPRLVLALLAWIAASILPAYAFFFIGGHLEGSRHLYFAAAAWSLLLSTVAIRRGGDRMEAVLRSAMIAVAVLWGASAYRHLEPWESAARERDRILETAETLRSADCGAYAVAGLPDSVRGAYVFRNGFDAALRRHGMAPAGHPDVTCDYVWTGRAFIPRP